MIADITGHRDWPGSGPFSIQMSLKGAHVGYYTHPDIKAGRYLIIKINPPGVPDTLVKGGFQDMEAAHAWLMQRPTFFSTDVVRSPDYVA